MKYFWKDIFFTVFALTVCFLIGGWPGLISGAVLGVLELSMSFDNAVVNASTLQDMSEAWRKRFLTWGMLIAVVGMRLIFPVLIVAITAGLNPIHVATMALHDPSSYATHLQNSHIQISGFGGAFLFMIFWRFFADEEKDEHWLTWLEKPIKYLSKFDMVAVLLTLITSILVSMFIGGHDGAVFMISAGLGIIVNLLVESLGNFLEVPNAGTQAAKAGLAGFLYLEVLDASFSFDGVIGAFAISNEVFIIALGLGIGAMAIRSLTIMLVEKGTLGSLKFLEASAFWAIGALSTIMFLNTVYDVPEVVTGLIGAGIIAAGAIHSIIKNQVPSGHIAEKI